MKVRIGNKLVEVDRIENGVPVIKVETEIIKHKSGRIDCTVKVPCIQIKAESKEIN